MRTVSVVLLAALGAVSVLAQEAVPPAPSGPVPSQAPAPAPGQGRGRGGPPRVAFIPDAPPLSQRSVGNPLTLPDGMTYGVVASVAVNSKGHVYVFHRMSVPLLEFDDQGRFVRGLLEGQTTRAHSVRVDREDNLWLVDTSEHTAVKISPRGDVLMTLGTRNVSGSGDEAAASQRFNTPSDVAIAANGDIYVAQGENGAPDPRVIRFDRTGRFLQTWSLAYSQGIRSNPHAIVIDRAGLVYVADREVMRIRVFQPDGLPVREIQMKNPVCGLFLDATDQLWIATGADGQVMRIDREGKILGFAGGRGTAVGEMGEAHMLAVAPNGDVYVADSVGRKIEAFKN